MILFTALFIADITKTGPSNFSFVLKAGEYKVTCYGAQGGSGYQNGDLSKVGGKGAYVTGTMTVTGTGTTFWAYVGSKGNQSPAGPNLGGFNGGGRGGQDNGGLNDKGDDASGGGGGATDLRIDDNSIISRIIVAAGGSGGAFTCPGAPGGDLDGYYRPSSTNIGISNEVNQNKGKASGFGGDGVDGDYITGSGGGGGWRGGISTSDFAIIESSSYKAVSHSGSSYISGFKGCINNSKMVFTSAEMEKDNKEGNGKIIIHTNFECSENCSSCTSSSSCTQCFDGFYLFEQDKKVTCRDKCPSNYFVSKNKKCTKCDASCKTCSERSNKCTSCEDNFYLSSNKCVSECSSGYYEANGICLKCHDPCSKCSSSADHCTSCMNNFILYKNKCYSTCPDGKFFNGDTCEDCDQKCSSCYSSPTMCTSCKEGFYLYEDKCIESCPPTTVELGGQCIDCKSPCKTCKSKFDFCLSCIDNFYLYENKCIAACPQSITVPVNGVCTNCIDHCKTCSSTVDHCTSCISGYYLFKDSCYADCSEVNDIINDKYYGKNTEKQECSECRINNCIECSNDYSTCTKCSKSYHLETGTCIHDPTNLFTKSSVYSFFNEFTFSSSFEKTFSDPTTSSSSDPETTNENTLVPEIPTKIDSSLSYTKKESKFDSFTHDYTIEQTTDSFTHDYTIEQTTDSFTHDYTIEQTTDSFTHDYTIEQTTDSSQGVIDREINIIGSAGGKKQLKSIWWIIPIVVGAILIAIIIIIVLLKRKKKKEDYRYGGEVESDGSVSEIATDGSFNTMNSCSIENPLRNDSNQLDPFDDDASESL